MDRLEKALERVQNWPEERRNEVAELIIALDEQDVSAEVDSETLAAIDEALDQVNRGERADSAEIAKLFASLKP